MSNPHVIPEFATREFATRQFPTRECQPWIALGVMLAMIFSIGCGGAKLPDLAEVQGTVVTSDGEVLDEVRVRFLPDPEKIEGFVGKAGIGTTDKQGKFELFYGGSKDYPGTAAGPCRVVLEDVKATNSSRDEEPILRRFARKYLDASTTDLIFDISTEDGQSIEIVVEPAGS